MKIERILALPCFTKQGKDWDFKNNFHYPKKKLFQISSHAPFSIPLSIDHD